MATQQQGAFVLPCWGFGLVLTSSCTGSTDVRMLRPWFGRFVIDGDEVDV